MSLLEVQRVTRRHDLRRFVRFPWGVYKEDPNWVPPLISDRMATLDPAKGPFYKQAEVALLLARRGRRAVGTVAVFVNHPHAHEPTEGGFGFFEVIRDYAVAERLLDAACEWLRARGASTIRGPTSFTKHEGPGVLVEGADCPPVMLQAHTPPYYKEFLERYGMEKDQDLFAWRAFRSQIGEELGNIPPALVRVADAARRRAGVTIRKLRMEDWDQEVGTAHQLFNATLRHLPDFSPTSESDFRRLANQMRPFLDPDLALFAEVASTEQVASAEEIASTEKIVGEKEGVGTGHASGAATAQGKPIGFCVAVPDVNRVLIRLNGRLFPLGWLKIKRYVREVKVVSFKLMGILEAYRQRGINALLYMEMVKAVFEKGYEWLEGSVTSEYNLKVNLIAQRLGAERYKHYRLYEMEL